MLIVSIVLVLVLLLFIFIVDFVLSNLAMFQTPFDIVIRVPFTQWSHTWEGVEFMYIIAGSVFLGALSIALSTWVLDTKRKLNVRSTRKELKRLQVAVEEAKASFPKEEPASEKSSDGEEAADVTPEEITRSFEDAVDDGDFLEETEEPAGQESVEPDDSTEDVIEEEKQLPQETPIEAEVVDSEGSSKEEHEERQEHKDS